MPTYDFACDSCGEKTTEAFGFHENHLVECPQCTKPMRKIIGAVPAILRGTGWGGK